MIRRLKSLVSTLALISLMGSVFCPPCCPRDGEGDGDRELWCMGRPCGESKAVVEADLGVEAQ